MSQFLSNDAAPALPKGVKEQIESVARTPSGMPVFRLVWGCERTYSWRGETHLFYRDHIERVPKLALPEYDLAGRFVGYSRYFNRGDVLPSVSLVPVWLETDIGVARWFVELAEDVDEATHRNERWTNENGEVELDDDGNAIDFLGEMPEGAVEYDFLWCVALHKNGCCENRQRPDGSYCFGEYREPSIADVDECRRRWRKIESQRVDNSQYGIERSIRDRYEEKAKAEDRQREALEAEMRDAVWKKRLFSDGHGLDYFTYSDFGKAHQIGAANQAASITSSNGE